MVRHMLGPTPSVSRIAKASRLSRQTVYRVKADPASAEAVSAWGV
jgi:hypothetical protein